MFHLSLDSKLKNQFGGAGGGGGFEETIQYAVIKIGAKPFLSGYRCV